MLSISLGRITALHARWMRSSPKGAMCDECQELNALHSSVVDGASIKIPERLTTIPTQPDLPEPFVLDILHQNTARFEETYQLPDTTGLGNVPSPAPEGAENMIFSLLSSEKMAVSEYGLIGHAARLARKHDIDLTQFVAHMDFSALSVAEKYAVGILLNLSPEQAPYIWNRFAYSFSEETSKADLRRSLIRSDILRRRDLDDRDLGGPLHLQRLYSSTIQGRAAFFEYLKEAVEDFRRRLIIVQVSA